MPLNFPENPVVGQGYQSGSAEVYQYNGSYWVSRADSSILQVPLGLSASFTPNHRRNVTAVSPGPYGNALIIADNKLFSHNIGSILPIRTHAMFNTYLGFNNVSSPEFMYEIAFPTEAGTLVDANIYNTSAYALFNNGNLYTWGNNGQGQLGTGDTTFRGLPTLVQTGVSEVYWHPSQNHGAPDIAFLLIRKADGKVYGTGYNAQGQLGLGDTTNRTSFTEITGIGTNPLYVGVCGAYAGWTIVQKSDGTIHAAGWNANGQLGDGSTTQRNSFVAASGWLHGTSSMRIVDHVAGASHNGAADTTGNSQLWLSNGTADNLMGAGYPAYGSIADGGTGATAISTPLKMTTIPSSKRFQKLIRVGTTYGTCHLLTTDGWLYGWGYNAFGQLGNGTTTTTATPAAIQTGVLDVDSGVTNWYTGLGTTGPISRKSDGYYSWGYNAHGLVGNGTTTDRSTPVKIKINTGTIFKLFTSICTASDTYTRIAIGNDNRYYCWGDNSSRAVDPSNTDDVLVPVEFSPRVLQR